MPGQKQDTSKPTAIIVHGANFLGEQLVETLQTQKTSIIAVDEFSRDKRSYINTLKNKYKVKTFDLSGIESLTKELKRVDYIFILLDQYLLGSSKFTSKKFLSETNSIDALFKIAIKTSAKVLLTTSISMHRRLTSLQSSETDKLSEMKTQNPYTPLELQRYAENLAAEYHDQAALDIRICRLGETIGEGMQLNSNTRFVNTLKEAVTKPRISIPGEGLDYAFYVHSLDAVYGIIKATFSNKTNGEVFTLAYTEEISSLNLAYRILELNPRAAEIVFTESETQEPLQQTYVPAKKLQKIGWEPKIPFEKALIESLEYFFKEYKVKWKDKPVPKTEKPEPKTKPKKHPSERTTSVGKLIASTVSPVKSFSSWVGTKLRSAQSSKISGKQVLKYLGLLAIGLVVYFVLLAPILQIAIGGSMGYLFGKRGYQEAMNLDLDKAEKSLERADYFVSLMNTGWQGLEWISYIPGVDSFYDETSKLTSGAEHLTGAGVDLSKGFAPYATYFKEFEPVASFNDTSGGGSREYLEELEEMNDGITYIQSANIEIALAVESLEEIDTSVYPRFISNSVDELIKKASQLNDTIATVNSFAPYAPDLLGEDGRKNYVVLFQNPMELRSTGGWLTSYALIGIEHGQVRSMTVDDVYNADGQLKITVNPPETMKKALGTEKWFLSLSNWSPDFPQSAEAAEYFLVLEDKVVSVDGVIAVDLEYVRDLIGIWDEIKVPGEDEPVTKENMYDKVIEIHREFTPGSTDKPVFLSNLANEILKKLLSDGKNKWSDVASVTEEALNEKHVLIYMHNAGFADTLDTIGWSGHVTSETNTVFPVEWNWGGNKANHFLTRSSLLKVNIIDENTIQQELQISYQNDSQSNTYPEGNYQNYIRIYLPEEAEITRVEGVNAFKFVDSDIPGLKTLSGNVTAPIQGSTSISVKYVLSRDEVEDFPLSIEPGGKIKYSLYFVKQPGLLDDPLTIEVTYPDIWEPVDLSDIHREINTLIQRTDLEVDKEFTLTWER